MDFPFTDNEKLVIKKTKSILNFCFSKKFFGTSKGPIGRVPEGPGVSLSSGLHGSAWIFPLPLMINR